MAEKTIRVRPGDRIRLVVDHKAKRGTINEICVRRTYDHQQDLGTPRRDEIVVWARNRKWNKPEPEPAVEERRLARRRHRDAIRKRTRNSTA